MADEIIVRLRGEGVDKFIAEMKKAGLAVEDTGKKTEKAGATIGKFGRTVGAAFTTAAIIQFGRVLARTAVDIDATGRKLSTVFGKATKDVEDFAKANANALGLTVNEYKRAAAAVGDLLIPIGFQRKEAAKLSNDLVKLSGALSAWTGGQLNATQVSEVLTKALLGEREQLKQLGIQISEADVSARLLEKGQKNLTGAALAQAKALASLELITEKSKDAQAAFADDTKTLAETQLELTASVREFRDELAQELIPVLVDLFDGLNKGIKGVRDLRDAFTGNKQQKEFAESIKDIADVDELRILALEQKLKLNEKERISDSKIRAGQTELYRERLRLVNLRIKELTAQEQVITLTEEENKETQEATETLFIFNELLGDLTNNLRTVAARTKDIDLSNVENAASQISAIIQGVITPTDIDPGELELDAFEAAKDAELQKVIDAEELKRQQIAQTKQSSISAARDAFNVASGFIQLELQQLEERRKKGLINEKQYERERSDLLRKQAIANKANAVFEIGLNTAAAITSALKAGPVAGPILAGVIGALAAAQLAQVLAAPIPQFAKGTKGHRTAPEGFAWVGEEGPELVQMRGGEKVITAKDSEHMMKLLAGYGIPVQFQSTSERLNKPMRRFDKMMREAGVDIDWNPLLMSNERNRYSLGKKLDRIHMAILDTNQRKMTRA